MNHDVDTYLVDGCMRCSLGGTAACKVRNWTMELKLLRSIVLDCGLTEEVKWGVPCYTFQNKKVLLVSAFKEYCAISFFKGALLSNTKGILVKPGENSQASRLIKFTNIGEIEKLKADVKACVLEAIEAEKEGLKVETKKNPEPIPEELERRFEDDPVLKNAFDALTPGRQRGYILYFTQPKKSSSRISRIEKCVPMILNGEGLHDKYKSTKKPNR